MEKVQRFVTDQHPPWESESISSVDFNNLERNYGFKIKTERIQEYSRCKHLSLIDTVSLNQAAKQNLTWASQTPLLRADVTGLVITTFERPEYVAECFRYLKKSLLRNVVVVIVDDASHDPSTIEQLRTFDIPSTPLIKIYKNSLRRGVAISLDIGWGLLANLGCETLVNLDSDAIVCPSWLSKIRSVFYEVTCDRPNSAKGVRIRHPRNDVVISGFLLSYPIREHEVYSTSVVRSFVGGINLFFTRQRYRLIRKYLITDLWDLMTVSNLPYPKHKIFCLKPSVVQHIGKKGMNSTEERFDQALDFNCYL